MNDALRQAASVDPEWAKKEQRRQWLVKVTVAGTLVALAVGAIAFVVGVRNSTEITKVEHSACKVEPAGQECQQTKAESSRAANLQVTCIPFFKAGYPCPKPGSTSASRANTRQTAKDHPIQGKGGDASKPESPGTSLPGPVSTGPTGEPEAAPEPTPEHPIKEAVGGVVTETGETVNGTVEELTCKLRLTC